MSKQEYPNITLMLKDGAPSIQLRNSAEETKSIAVGDNVNEFILDVAKQVGYEGKIEDVFELASRCDELFITFPDLAQTAFNPNMSWSWIKTHVDQASSDHEQANHDSKELNQEIEQYWQGDVLASVINEIYLSLILNTVLAAAEIGTGIIRLEENSGDSRFREKMSLELAKFDAQLTL